MHTETGSWREAVTNSRRMWKLACPIKSGMFGQRCSLSARANNPDLQNTLSISFHLFVHPSICPSLPLSFLPSLLVVKQDTGSVGSSIWMLTSLIGAFVGGRELCWRKHIAEIRLREGIACPPPPGSHAAAYV